jgi:VanZ family protein
MAVIWVLSDQPDPNPAPDGWGGSTSSLAHVAVFGALCAAWAFALPGRSLALAIALAVAYGVVDELHQSTTPGRDATPWDVLLDAIGALLAAMLVRRRLLPRPRAASTASRARSR